MDAKQLKEWVRQNLVVETRPTGYSNSVHIELRFADEDLPFSSTIVYIPRDAE